MITRADVRAALREALSVLWPVECAGCGAPDVAICAACRGALTTPIVADVDGVRAHASAAYAGQVRQAILAFKEHGRVDIAAVLARAMALQVRAALADGARDGAAEIVVVAVPSSSDGRMRRGYSPVRMLLRRAGIAGIELQTARRSGVQKGRGVDERRLAATGSMRVHPRHLGRIMGRQAIVVDDVVTSGATVREAMRALRAAGCVTVAIAALAHTPLRLATLTGEASKAARLRLPDAEDQGLG